MSLPILLIIIVLSVIFIFLFSSVLHHRRVKKYLLKEIPADETTRQKTANFLEVESIAATGVSLFDVLYHTSKLDPFVLKGVEHLHHAQHFENLGDLTGFMKANIINSKPGTQAWRKMIHKYKGYTGEEQGMNHITHSGAAMVVPHSGTNPGHDAVVNGHHVDFAVTDSPSYVQSKLDSSPHTYVWTNKEMGHAFKDNPRVIVDPDLSSQDAFHVTHESISGIHDLGDFIHHVPIITLAISSTRNTYGVVKGKKEVGTAIEHIALDTAGVGFGGFGGGKLGLVAGLALAPATGGTSTVIIPSVTTLLGSIIGVFTGKNLTNRFKQRHLRSAISTLSTESKRFKMLFLKKFDKITMEVRSFYEQKKERCQYARRKGQNWFMRLFFPTPIVKFYAMAILQFSNDREKTRNFYLKLKHRISGNDSKEGGLILFAQGLEILNEDPDLISAYEDVADAVNTVEKEKRKLE